MGSEVFNLKSLYLEDTVVRGARVSINNASSTRTIEVNPGDVPVVKTGETGVSKEYLIKASLKGNDLNGYGTFVNNSDIVTHYTGAQNLSPKDRIKLDGDQTDYAITGMNGENIYLAEKYSKEDISGPDTKSGTCSIVKTTLGSLKYEEADNSIVYDKDAGDWGVTGIQMSDPIEAPTGIFEIDTGVNLKFQNGVSKKKPDVASILSVRKTLVSNNTSPMSDVSLSPMPYPHSSLQVLMGKNGTEIKKAVEGEDYIVNYTDGADILYPIPPYEERKVAYIKFLGSMTDEVQVASIDSNFAGNMTIDKETVENGTVVVRPVQEIISQKDFSIKVGGVEKERNSEYISDNAAGMVTFVEHSNREELIGALTYPKKLIWDGISVIRGVKIEDVDNTNNLVIPGVSGLEGIDYTVYFEDTDTNNLIRDVDFIIDPESGAFRLNQPTKADEAVLVSYYVEGEDIKDEKVELNTMRLNSFPLISGSLILTKKYSRLSDTGKETNLTRVLVEGIDFKVSYVTGHIELFASSEITIELKASYTPMAQINCIAQSVTSSLDYKYTIVDDVLSFSQNDIGSKDLIFKVNNPVVSVPQKILFDEDKVDSNYNFSGSIDPENILSIKIKGTDKEFVLDGSKYDDLKKEITLDLSVNKNAPLDSDIVTATYTFQSDILPYAPLVLIYTTISAGEDSFLIEGYDKTDILRTGTIIRVDNRDPNSTNYFVIRSVAYQNQSTKVDIYGSFPEDATDPTFSVFDDQIVWGEMSDDVTVDTSAPIDSESIVFNGGGLFLTTNLEPDSLLLVNNQEIYTVTSIETVNNVTTVGIYPALRTSLTSNIKYTTLPIYDAGLTSLPAKKMILPDSNQPAFTLWYNNPEGFEGSAKVFYVKDKIIIKEYVSGVENPVPYEFVINDFQDIYILAKTIQATRSTFKDNVQIIQVPDYNPFTIAHNDKEEYYLGDGIWNPKTIIPFEEENFVSLPYTFNVTPELFKYDLVEIAKGKDDFTVKNANVTFFFQIGNLLAFVNKVSGRLFFSRVMGTDYTVEGHTVINLSSNIIEDMIDPFMYVCPTVTWEDFSNSIAGIDHNSNSITFSGILNQNIRVGTLISLGNSYVYQVSKVTQGANSFTVTFNSDMDAEVTAENYSGYVKISSIPVSLLDPGPQPYIEINYSVPKTHVGYASVKIDVAEITFKEVLDNFNTKETILRFSDYEIYEDLFKAIQEIDSYAAGYKPFSVTLNSAYSDILKSNFESYAIRSTVGQFVALPGYIAMTVSAFDINYTPDNYEGTFSVKITSDQIRIKEKAVMPEPVGEIEKETIIPFNETSDLYDLVNNVLPEISSVVGGKDPPFSTVLRNQSVFGLGKWDVTHITNNSDDYVSGDQVVYGIVESNSFVPVGILNERSLIIDTDYTLSNGIVELTTPVASLERYLINYMGLDNLFENEGEAITCTCKFITLLPIGYRLDVYMEYINEDQFYIQKLTERKFTEIVTVPQVEQITGQKGSAGGQGKDSGSTNNSIPNYEGGVADINYLLRDEYIKKQLYVRFYKWYKQRLRGLCAELQLGLGFKFGHSNFVGEVGDNYSLEDQYVENEDYTLTKDADLNQIENGNSKFFPVGYEDSNPKYYERFGKEYLSFNEVFCCNITYRDTTNNQPITVGVVKSDRPYWNKSSDLVFKVWEDQYINKNLVGYYNVDVPEDDRSFRPSTYTFLKVIDTDDQIKINEFKNYYTISEIVSPSDKTYEYIKLKAPFTDKGIKTYNIVDNKNSFDTLMDSLPPDGYRIWIKRQDKEDFPMFDDNGSLGATAYSDSIEGLVKDSRRIKKAFHFKLIKLFFPTAEPTKNFTISVKKDSESGWETLGSIDLSKLTFKEERNVDDVMDALRYDFVEKFKVPPVTVYDIKEDSDQGFFRYFYLSFERVYDANSGGGYYSSIVLRAKDRNWWFKISNGGETPIIGDYGFNEEKIYENFYDPENIYKKLLLEKQAWQTEELIIRDIYDFSDKIARAFENGDLNQKNSKFQDYLAAPDGSSTPGISDILRSRIPAYEKQLKFLVDNTGPVYKTLYPDMVHAEDVASPEITLTFNQTMYAWNLYNTFYSKLGFYYRLNEDNNYVWKNDYVNWVMSIERGILYQEKVKSMYETQAKTLTLGLIEVPTIKISLEAQTVYTIVNPLVTVSSTYEGKYVQINYGLIRNDSMGQTTLAGTCLVYMFNKSSISSVPTIVYKSISEVCAEISGHSYEGVKIFSAENVFDHFENNSLSKSIYIGDQPIDPVNGLELKTTNVADHRSSDPRILFLNKNIEDRVYTHGIRELPGFDLKYLGNYYLLKVGVVGLTISFDYGTTGQDFKYGVFRDETGEKVLTVAYGNNNNLQYFRFPMYEKTSTGYVYKTYQKLADEISETREFSAAPARSLTYQSCETLMYTSELVSRTDYQLAVYASLDDTYNSMGPEVNQLYYKAYVDSLGVKKMDIIFYKMIADGALIYRSEEIWDTFTFSCQKGDGSFKTLSEICSELGNFKFRGARIMSASSVYEAEPKGGLSTTFITADSRIIPIGIDWDMKVYVDTYVEAMGGTDSNSRRILDLKNAVFSFPMYTANGNPNKQAIEDIPVAGKWIPVDANQVIEVGCIDGFNWTLSFSDYVSGDYKSYMIPQEILDDINNKKSITEAQYTEIRYIEDRPAVPILKELVLTREGSEGTNSARFNLRKYSTLSELVEAIVNAKFNAAGEYDVNGVRSFFTASLIGDPVVVGKYRSNELDTRYIPIVKSFTVVYANGTTKYMNEHPIGWQLLPVNLKGNVKHRIKMSEKRYSYGDSHTFVMSDPERAYIDTLSNNPQGFRRDTLAFDIYSWDYNAKYEVLDNWMYFKCDSVDYSMASDLGQPNKTLGYGIPLAGSGHPSTDYRESLLALVNRINNNGVVNKFFYANLKFTRDNITNPGYFEYNSLPNFKAFVPRSEVNRVMLKDDSVMRISPDPGYRFNSSNITIADSADTLSLSCEWEKDYTYERTLFFNESANRLFGDLATSIDNIRPPYVADAILSATVNPSLASAQSRDVVPTFVEKYIGVTGVNLNVYVWVGVEPYRQRVLVNAVEISLNSVSGTNYTVQSVTYEIPSTNDRIVIKINLTYHNTFTLVDYDMSGDTLETLGSVVSSLRPYDDNIFSNLFDCTYYSDSFKKYEANRLFDVNSGIGIGGVSLTARLSDIVAFNVVVMAPEATITVNGSNLSLITFNTYNKSLEGGTDLHAFVQSVKGDFFNGFLSCDVLPLIVPSTTYGGLNVGTYNFKPNNVPAHVYFGVLGDVKFVQISDHNLHVQYNYIKERLGMPWTDASGEVVYDYYTPETYNENNPCAIDLKNFLGYLRTGRYNQIKNSLINEATVANKYLWLYMKFHKEFGCDQRAKALKSMIEKGETDLSTLNQIL